MKIFQSIERRFGSLGIYIRQAFQENRFNSKNLTILCIFVVFTILTMAFFLFEAENFREYSESFYVTVCTIFNSFAFTIFMWKHSELFELIMAIETTIQKRKHLKLKN